MLQAMLHFFYWKITYRDGVLHVSSIEHWMVDVKDNPVKQSTV